MSNPKQRHDAIRSLGLTLIKVKEEGIEDLDFLSIFESRSDTPAFKKRKTTDSNVANTPTPSNTDKLSVTSESQIPPLSGAPGDPFLSVVPTSDSLPQNTQPQQDEIPITDAELLDEVDQFKLTGASNEIPVENTNRITTTTTTTLDITIPLLDHNTPNTASIHDIPSERGRGRGRGRGPGRGRGRGRGKGNTKEATRFPGWVPDPIKLITAEEVKNTIRSGESEINSISRPIFPSADSVTQKFDSTLRNASMIVNNALNDPNNNNNVAENIQGSVTTMTTTSGNIYFINFFLLFF